MNKTDERVSDLQYLEEAEEAILEEGSEAFYGATAEQLAEFLADNRTLWGKYRETSGWYATPKFWTELRFDVGDSQAALHGLDEG